MIRKLVTSFSLLLVLLSIAIPRSIAKFVTLDPQEYVNLSDFNETDDFPSDDNSEEGSAEAEVLYVPQKHRTQIKVTSILPTSEQPHYSPSYCLKLFIPPSA